METEEEEDDDGEVFGKDGARGLGTEKLSYKEMNELIDESVRKKKPRKRVPAPDSDKESIPRDKPKKALPVRVSLGMVLSLTFSCLVRRSRRGRIPRRVVIRMRIVL